MEKEFSKKIAALKDDIERISSNIAELTSSSTDELQANSEEVIRQAKAQIKKASQFTQAKAEEVDEFVTENPWLVVGIATAAGFVLGHLLHQTKSKQK